METFSALLAICAGNSPVPGEFPTQRPVTRSFDVYFDLRPNKWLSKQSWGWWFESLSWSLWRQRNGTTKYQQKHADIQQKRFQYALGYAWSDEPLINMETKLSKHDCVARLFNWYISMSSWFWNPFIVVISWGKSARHQWTPPTKEQ